MNKQDAITLKILAIVAGFFVLSLFAVFIAVAKQQYSVQENIRIQKQIAYINQNQQKLNEQLQQLTILTGFDNRATVSNIQDISIKIIDLLTELNTKIGQIKGDAKQEEEPKTNTNNLYHTFVPVALASSNMSTSDTANTNTENSSLFQIEYVANMEKILIGSFDRIRQLQQRIEVLKTCQTYLNQKITEQNKYQTIVLNDLNSMLDRIENDKNIAEKNFSQQTENLQKIKSNAEEAKLSAERKIGEIQELTKKQTTKFNTEVSQKTQKIQELQAEKYGRTNITYSKNMKQIEFLADEETIDGKIVFADPRSQSVYINLGVGQKVLKGLKFDVYRQAPKAKRALVGRIEITKIMDKVSLATIIEIKNPLDPIVNGDMIMNPLFNYQNPIHISIAGEFRKMKNEEAKKLIEQIGAKVEPEVTVKTNFVVIAQKNEQHDNYKKACAFGVTLINEETILRYIGD